MDKIKLNIVTKDGLQGVVGYLYKDAKDRFMFVHKMPHSAKGWTVSEPFSGLGVGRTQSSTRHEAMELALKQADIGELMLSQSWTEFLNTLKHVNQIDILNNSL